MRGAIGQIVAEPGGAELSLKMLDESAAVALPAATSRRKVPLNKTLARLRLRDLR
jgi:hypothetical protein